ncbi:MAG: UDP-N-acetylmuramate dehydrogenase, partial [Candidatus Omnitrophica bacterium]|nr:UDP-N-acetylmuramate dehydrogenase [Candidatus Omnitrophota bacterium]
MNNPFDIKRIPAPAIEKANLAKFTTFQLGGSCPLLVYCETPLQVKNVVQYFFEHDIEKFITIGEGSNVLVSDQGIDEYVIRFYTNHADIQCHENEVNVGAGTKLDDVALFCAQKGLEGFNFASGIPGTVAGAISGNAGAFGHQISETIKNIVILNRDGEEKTLSPEQCLFAYRYSRFKDSTEIIIKATFHLHQGSAAALLKEREEILRTRREKHPDYRKTPCAGSFFKNIESTDPLERRQAAGLFLEQVGAKTMSVGGAGVFDKHANIIIKKTNQCTASDVYALSQKMQK